MAVLPLAYKNKEQANEIQIVGEAGNAHEVLDAVERIRPGTIILVVHLIGRSGITLLETKGVHHGNM